MLLTGVAQPRPKPSARMHKLGGEARASPLLFTVEESPAARPSDADLLVGDGMLPVHTGTSSVQ